MKSLGEWIHLWPRAGEICSIHVDELTEWQPADTSYEAWATELVRLWELAKRALTESDVVVATLSFEPTEQLQTFVQLTDVPLDSFTPPSLYLLSQPLAFSTAAEQYYRVLSKSEFHPLSAGGTAIVRSARSPEALAQSWEFDNALYVTSGISP